MLPPPAPSPTLYCLLLYRLQESILYYNIESAMALVVTL